MKLLVTALHVFLAAIVVLCAAKQRPHTVAKGTEVSHHLVTTVLTRKETSWKSEALSYAWLASPKLNGIPKTVYSSDEYLPPPVIHSRRGLAGAANMKSSISSSVLRQDANLTPWGSILGDLNLTQHDIRVLPLVNPRRSQECPGILSFIIDNYARLPDVTYFVHGYPFNHNLDILAHISAMKRWTPEFIGFTHLNNQAYLKTSFRTLHGQPQCHTLIQMLGLAIDTDSWAGDTALAGECCGQFAVTRERILEIPLDWFVLARKLVYEGQCCYCFEYLWHFILGEPAIMPPGATSTAKGGFKRHSTDGKAHDFGQRR